ncbi:hypothetical protein CC78DRAFT_587039 [Lojkania enalia]|uniref:Uncharacterized protein n=1 Tax=Lojkania enalia TaxID=147567 RepID=A0A9P4MXS6_9PLEO|nr:hypothetical protein CC78DRAFT_587039 [Didymosphaeria enalia]
MAFLLYELASDEIWQRMLLALTTCVYWGLGLPPGVRLGLPGVTPGEGATIDDIFIPRNMSVPFLNIVTVVHTRTITLQTNLEAFLDPDSYNPTCWLLKERAKPVFASYANIQTHTLARGGVVYQAASIAEVNIDVLKEVKVKDSITQKDVSMCDQVVAEPAGGKGTMMNFMYLVPPIFTFAISIIKIVYSSLKVYSLIWETIYHGIFLAGWVMVAGIWGDCHGKEVFGTPHTFCYTYYLEGRSGGGNVVARRLFYACAVFVFGLVIVYT